MGRGLQNVVLAMVLTLAWSGQTHAKSDVDLSIQLLTHDIIGKVTLDIDELMQWMKPKTDGIQAYLQRVDGDHEVMILLTLHKDRDASVTIGTVPVMNEGIIAGLKEIVDSRNSPRTKLVDYSFLYHARVNKGRVAELEEFRPAIILPEDERRKQFARLSLPEKKRHLQQWIRDEVLPVAAEYEVTAEERFKGVRGVGTLVKEGVYRKKSVTELTDNNPLYWRAMMEMGQGNQLIPFTKACMHLANGELDMGKRVLSIVKPFSAPSTLPDIYRKPLSEMLSLIDEGLTAEIQKGISIHDAGKHKEAAAHYKRWLQHFPKSAWLNYEYYLTQVTDGDGASRFDALWDEYRPIIYQADPMYPLNVRARNGEEGYRLSLRMRLNELFKSRDQFKRDLLEYADIALDLKNYAIAAHIYWMLLSHLPSKEYGERNLTAYYLYSIDKLGIRGMEENFVGNFPAEYDRIEQERRSMMEGSKVYQSFKKGAAGL